MTKPHNCEDCGETNPSKFRNRRKSICVKCYNIRALKKNTLDPNYVPMTTEEQKTYANDFSYLKARQKEKWGELYG